MERQREVYSRLQQRQGNSSNSEGKRWNGGFGTKCKACLIAELSNQKEIREAENKQTNIIVKETLISLISSKDLKDTEMSKI